jgi:hypothetical protein
VQSPLLSLTGWLNFLSRRQWSSSIIRRRLCPEISGSCLLSPHVVFFSHRGNWPSKRCILLRKRSEIFIGHIKDFLAASDSPKRRRTDLTRVEESTMLGVEELFVCLHSGGESKIESGLIPFYGTVDRLATGEKRSINPFSLGRKRPPLFILPAAKADNGYSQSKKKSSKALRHTSLQQTFIRARRTDSITSCKDFSWRVCSSYERQPSVRKNSISSSRL